MSITTKSELVQWVYTELGGNVINIELDDNTIEQHIGTAIDKFDDYSSDITYQNAYVLTLSADVSVYDMPDNTVGVYNFASESASGGINTPFSSVNIFL